MSATDFIVYGPGCPGDPIPGVAAPMNSPSGVQACGDCNLYDSDIDAARALARFIPGSRVFVQMDINGLIRSGTDPEIRDGGHPVDLRRWYDRWLNQQVVFCPATSPDERPAVQLHDDVLVFVYMRQGELVITVDTETYEGPALPIRFNVNNAQGVWTGEVSTLDEDEYDHSRAKEGARNAYLQSERS